LCLEMNCVLRDEQDVVCTGACAYRRITSLSAVGGHRAQARRARPPSGLRSIRGPGAGQQRGRSAERQRANGGAVGGSRVSPACSYGGPEGGRASGRAARARGAEPPCERDRRLGVRRHCSATASLLALSPEAFGCAS